MTEYPCLGCSRRPTVTLPQTPYSVILFMSLNFTHYRYKASTYGQIVYSRRVTRWLNYTYANLMLWIIWKIAAKWNINYTSVIEKQ